MYSNENQEKDYLKIEALSKTKWTEHFTKDECVCSCGSCDKEQMDPGFMWLMEKIRLEFDEPMYVTSAARCELYNRKIGGVTNSWHMTKPGKKAKAMDVCIKNRKRYPELEKIASKYMQEVIIYTSKNFIHIGHPFD